MRSFSASSLDLALSLVCLALGLMMGTGAARAEFVINEFMPFNNDWESADFLDEDGERHGFVELRNTAAGSASTLGWSIADESGAAAPFVLPDRSVAAGETLIVWLSNKDRSAAGAPLHASWSSLKKREVFLFDPQQVLRDSVSGLRIPADYSVGRCLETDVPGYYYDRPSPNAANPIADALEFVIPEEHVSLPVGLPFQLEAWPSVATSWSSDNPNVTVDANGLISAGQDALSPDGQAVITVDLVGGFESQEVDVTIVDWVANVSHLEIEATPTLDVVLGKIAGGLVYAVDGILYETADGPDAGVAVGVVPEVLSRSARLRSTPSGFFLRNQTKIFHSTDLTAWTLVWTLDHGGLEHLFDATYDPVSQATYVVAGEYSAGDPDAEHSLYRGVYPDVGVPSWSSILDFRSLAAWQSDPSLFEAVRHLHVARFDPHSSALFVGTGDADPHSRLYVSHDFGSSWTLLGLGEQSYRALAIWFTPNAVYWNTDSTAPQSVWRIQRSEQTPAGAWPSLSPLLTTGSTIPGVRYFVDESGTPGTFPVAVGEIYTESVPRVLSATERVRPIGDPTFDYREEVAQLDNGSHWFELDVTSEQGQTVHLFATAPEGRLRDDRGRVFGVRELLDGTPIVQEVLLVDDEPGPFLTSLYTQWVPIAQAPSGSIYFQGRDTAHANYQARLNWFDDAGSAPTPPSPPAALPKCVVPEPALGLGLLVGGACLSGVSTKRRRSSLR